MTADPQSLGRIGRYELLDRLGAGGMGEVFLARTTGTAGFEKQVVIKKILPHLANQEAFVRRFEAEGKLVVQLRHAGIAQVLDMGEDGGTIYLAMEYVEGRDLRELMRLSRGTGEDAPPELKVALLVQILEALDHAHHCTDADGEPLGIIHRDVSPSNIMVSGAGQVKLLDFGIARAADRLGLSVSGSVQGKFGYMSPQQAAGGALDARSDQFSVGVVAWELFAGERPFDGQSDLETLDRIRHRDPGSLADACPDAPPEVVAAVDRLLAKDPADRFPDALDAAKALHAYLSRVGAMVGAREMGAWVTRVLENLPPEARDRPSLALSLDDALRIPLEGGGGPATATATATASAEAVVTPAPEGAAAVAVSEPPPTPSTPTHTVTSVGEQVKTPAGRLILLLVVLNVLLLAAVGLLILQLSEDDAPDPEPEHVAAPVVDRAPVPTPTPTPQPEPAPVEPAPAPAPRPTVAGRVTGVALGSLDLPAPAPAPTPPAKAEASATVSVTVKTTPPGATVTVSGHGAGPAPRRLKLPRGARRSGEATLAGHAAKPFSFTASDAGQVVRVQLEPLAQGRVTFRFYPASAKARIDGKPVGTPGSNVVDVPLAAGKHQLRLEAPSGVVRRVFFEVEPGKTKNLKTLEVAAEDPAPDP